MKSSLHLYNYILFISLTTNIDYVYLFSHLWSPVCKTSDRNEFNKNLVAAFTQEYQRARAAGTVLPGNY